LGMLAESYLDLSAATMGPAPTLAVLFNPFCLFTTAQVLALKGTVLLLLTCWSRPSQASSPFL
jgi:hypothetical protein